VLKNNGFELSNAPLWYRGIVMDNLIETARTKLYF